MPKKIEKCFLCNSTDDITDDHIPPKNIFKPPLPNNLITVASCKKCNNSYSKDEEYFRVCVATQGTFNKTGQWIWKNKVVNSTFERSPKLKKSVSDKLVEVDVYSTHDIYIGKHSAVLYDTDRIKRVLEKICKGLFIHHYPKIDLNVLRFEINMTEISDEIVLILSYFKKESIGGDTFIYWHVLTNDDSYRSMWFLLFYTKTLFTIHTYRK
ncbi:MAG: hypothetical protein AAB071_04865 [Bacteroidota bacterium]